MSEALPALGYPSRTEAVLAMRGQGMGTKAIAKLLDIQPQTVTALEHSALRSAKRAKRPAEEHGRTILFPVDVLDALAPHAARRGIHVNHLARRIVEIALDDGMVDAILDDAEELGGKE